MRYSCLDWSCLFGGGCVKTCQNLEPRNPAVCRFRVMLTIKIAFCGIPHLETKPDVILTLQRSLTHRRPSSELNMELLQAVEQKQVLWR